MKSIKSKVCTYSGRRANAVKILQLLFVIVGILVINGRLLAQQTAEEIFEYQVKAAFLFNFIKFVDWPDDVLPDTLDTMTIGVVGQGPLNTAIRSIAGKKVKDREIIIKFFGKFQEIHFSHVLFVNESEMENRKAVLKLLEGSSTLTVGEFKNFARDGGVINFFKHKNKVRFEVNLDAADEAHLIISSKLLNLAKIVNSDK